MATKSAAKAISKRTSSKTTTTKSSAKKAPAKKAAPKIVVIGTLTDEGVECQAMREDKTKKLFTLVPKSKLKGFKVGDHVRVAGTLPGVSFCMQGTTVSIVTIKRVK